MRWPFYLLMVGGGSLAQTTVVPVVAFGGVVPDIPLVLTILVALRRGSELGLLTGFGFGLAQDLLGGGLLGIQALSKGAIGFWAGGLPGFFLTAQPVVQLLTLILGSVGEGALRFVLLRLFASPPDFLELFGHIILPQTLYNGVVGGLALLSLYWIRRARA